MSAEKRSFVDTNILVYAYDSTAGSKHDRARSLTLEHWDAQAGCLSIQVLLEFFVTVTRKLPQPLDPRAASIAVEGFAEWTVHVPDTDDVRSAIELHDRYRISVWDAMIVQSAASLGCEILYTEDLNAGQRYDGVLVVNPFA